MQLSKCLAPGALAALAILVTPAASSARSYNVYGLGMNGAGCDGWAASTNAPSKFLQAQSCSNWYTEAKARTTFKPSELAGATMSAPYGTVITGFALDAAVTMASGEPGMTWRQTLYHTSGYTANYLTNRTIGRTHYTLGSLRSADQRPRGTRVRFDLYCSSASGCKPTAIPGRLAHATMWNSHVVVDDYTNPRAASLFGLSSGWNSGAKTLKANSGDIGGGVERVNLSVDGGVTQTRVQSCRRVHGGGYTRPQPCPTSSVVTSFPVNGSGSRVDDGSHSLVLSTVDAAGNISYARKSFKVDNHAPAAVGGAAVAGGQGWHRSRSFAIGWRNPAAGGGAPIAAARYTLGRAPRHARDGTRVAGADISRLSLRMPSDGARPLFLWVEDEAGNTDHHSARALWLRSDTTPPAGSFQSSEDPANPREIRVATRERTSGLTAGPIEYRPLGTGAWRPIATRRAGSELVAVFPEDRVPRGSYELRARLRDGAGNATSVTRRGDGRPMRIRSPLRPATALSATLAGRRGSRRTGRSLLVRYGRGARLRGRLRTAGGEPLTDAPLSVLAKIPGQEGYRPIRRVTTGRAGGYALRLGPGPSRRLLVTYGGNPALRPTHAGARLRVRAAARLRLSARRLRVGRVLRFTGRVRSHVDWAFGSEGKLVQVQFRDGRRWRPAVALTRTDEEGSYSIAYRFRRITRPTRIRFRVLVPREGGWPYATGRSRSRVVDVYPRR